MNRPEAIYALKPLLDLLLSLKREFRAGVPLLWELAVLATDFKPPDTEPAGAEPAETGPLKKRIHRRYLRLCQLSSELGRLDFKNPGAGVSPEDYIFSRIDFSRYMEMDEKEFVTLFPEGLEDFDDAFFMKNFRVDREKIQSLIEKSYKKAGGKYIAERENPLIHSVLSIMRTLDISLEDSALFTAEEIREELNKLPGFAGRRAWRSYAGIRDADALYPLLVTSLDGALISHGDGMTTKLFINGEGDLAGTFRPGNKPWTRVLIPKASFPAA